LTQGGLQREAFVSQPHFTQRQDFMPVNQQQMQQNQLQEQFMLKQHANDFNPLY